MDRRGFLSTSGYALGGAALAASLAQPVQAASKSPDRKLGLALIGLGGFSTRTIGPELHACRNVRLAGVVTGDPNGKGRQWAEKHGFDPSHIYTYDTMDQLRHDDTIDFVHVVTPNGLHEQHTIRAAAAGKHVMCEKPMATSSEQCRRMIAACQKHGVQLGVDYRLHYEPHHVEMIRLAREQVYGRLHGLTAEFSWNRGDNKPWLLDKALSGGGAFFDTGVYCVQAGCYMTGENPVSVSAVGSTHRDVYPAGIEETMSATLDFPSGVVMQARASFTNGHHSLVASSGRGAFGCQNPPGKHGSTFGQSAGGGPNPKTILLPDGNQFKQRDTLQLAVLLDAFAESLLGRADFLCPGEMGLRDILVTEAVYHSVHQQGTRVAIDY